MAPSYKGRGAPLNPAGRFNATQLEAVHDGWFVEEAPASVATCVEPDHARSVITHNDSPDIPFEQSINPYRGCEHGCPFCYARPSHAYMGLSAGLDFESHLFYKADAARLLRAELARRGYVCRPIMLGSNTDPYQPIERQYAVTRSLLTVLQECRHPLTIVTKGALIRRDLDLLAVLARDGLVNVVITLATLQADLKRILEPRAASPQARLSILRELAAAGVPTGVLVAPVIPALTDHELEDIVAAAAGAGAGWAGYVLLRLPYEVKTLFREWLELHFPQRAAHVMSVVRSMRGGRDNDPEFGSRMRGQGPYAQLIRDRFRLARARAGLGRPPPAATTTLFRPPRGDAAQMELGL